MPEPSPVPLPGFPGVPSAPGGIEAPPGQGLPAAGADPLHGPAIRCAGLVKRYKDVTAVAGLDLEVRRGECFGLLGPNGAGKTTTVEILEGLLPADAGLVDVLGHTWGRGGDHACRERLGVLLQETRFPEKLTVLETVRLFRSFYRNGRDPEQAITEVEMDEKRRARVGKLSGGQRQRLALACALAGDPELLFLDEPTTGLDPQARRMIWDLVEGFKRKGGTVLLTTHYMEEAARLCDRVAVMDHGRMIALGTPSELIASLDAAQIVEFVPCPPLDLRLLDGLPGVRDTRERDGRLRLTVTRIGHALPALLSLLEERGIEIASLTTHQPTLEDVFIHLTGRELRDE